MTKAAALVREAGGVVIFDEVQAGFGRTGSWWGYEVMGAEPDIVAMGKPMGSGYPLSGVGSSPDVAAAFHTRSGYFNTTAGTPVQAAVGSAVIDVIENEKLLDRVNDVGAYLRGELSQFEDRYQSVGQVRGHGMFFAIDLINDAESRTPDRELAVDLVERIKNKGCLLSNAGQFNNSLKIRPPLVFEKQHAEHLLTVLTECMDQASA
jgi:4-aminobutyrate aminotransferase-like enzyme